LIKLLVLLVILSLAVWSDIRTYRIRNWLTALGLATGMLFQYQENGMYGLAIWGTGVLLPVVVFGILFALKMFGAGDVKLFSVVGAFLGSGSLWKIILLALLIGGVMSAGHMMVHDMTRDRLQYLANYISAYLKTGKVQPYYDKVRDGRKPVIHFSIAIFLGTWVQMCIWR